jgi:hypothetical protein
VNQCATCGLHIEGGFRGYQSHLTSEHTHRTKPKMFEESKLVPKKFTKWTKKQIVEHAESTWLKDFIIA